MKKRTLTVGKVTVVLEERAAADLNTRDVLYPCGVEHDLHLNPERSFTLMDVEDIILAITGLESSK